MYKFINRLPDLSGKTLNECVQLINNKLQSMGPIWRLEVESQFAKKPVEDYFNATNHINDTLDCGHGTIHSIKGETFDGVLLFLRKNFPSRKHYKTIINDLIEGNELVGLNKEEMRTVYVAITRPRKLLWVAVPFGTEGKWRELFQI